MRYIILGLLVFYALFYGYVEINIGRHICQHDRLDYSGPVSQDFHWSIIPILTFTIYAYVNELQLGNYASVVAGLTFLSLDVVNELFNTMVYYRTGCALWETPGSSSLLILPGWNIEILFMFAIAGLTFAKMLSMTDSRLLKFILCLIMSTFCVSVEMYLNHINVLVWKYAFWDKTTPLVIWFFGYLHFFGVSMLIHSKL
jgi:hypothetical protein